MSDDSFLKKLKGFTPESSGLDRDSLMFAAGQASARNERRGNWLVVILATSQMISLVLLTVVLWPGREPAVGQVAVLPPGVPAVAAPNPPADPPPALFPDDMVHRENRLEFVRKNRAWLLENLKLVEPPAVIPPKSGDPEAAGFEVSLLDGRKIMVRPRMEKLASYHITADMMEQQVRRRLAELFIQNPAKANLFAGIVNPGPDVPVRSRAHPTIPGETQTVSTGEPLDQLAEVEITGTKGPQAADLERMVRIHWITYGTVHNDKGMPRAKFEKIFGVGEEVKAGIWSWSIGGCRVLARFEGEPAKVGVIDYGEAAPPPNFDALAPSERGPYFRAVAKIDRDFLFAFLRMRYREADAGEIANLRRYLDETAGTMEWTEKERGQLLREIPQ
jgi:hypothetical protein